MTYVLYIFLAAAAAMGTGGDAYVLRAYYDDVEEVRALVRYDLHEAGSAREKYVLLTANDMIRASLESNGWHVVEDAVATAALRRRVVTFYGGYRTVDELYADCAAVTAAHSRIAEIVEYGDAYCRSVGGAVTPGGQTQAAYRLRAVRVTNRDIMEKKPVLFLMAAIHAREITTPEVAMRMIDHSDGSSRLYAAAYRCVEHDLPDEQAIECIRQYARQRPFPRTWSTEAIVKRLRDAEQRAQRGAAYEVDDEGLVPLGRRDPRSGRLVLSPRRTMPTAEAYAREFHDHPERPTILTYADLVMNWEGNRYVAIENAAVKHQLQPWLHEARRYIKLEDFELVPFESNPGTVKAALESIQQLTHLDATVTPPAWLMHADKRPDPRELLPCRSRNLHIPTGKVYRATPALFTTNALGFDYDPDAPAPVRWLSFLNQLWPDDAQSIELLQEWFGYCLTLDTSQQKMLLITGPKRSGKGTIGRVLSQLVGPANVCGPTTTSLAGTFGLQPLIGKSLAVVSDARFHGDNIAIVVERVLCITGEDTLTIDRKHLPSVTMKLPTRLMFFTNELPRLADSSAAIAGRFLTLRLTRSFFGQEDSQLTDKLLAELPGVLLWALQGWLRLRGRGYFVQPDSVREAIQELEDLASPVGAFVRDCCVVGPGRRVWIDDLYRAWRSWCERDGRSVVTTKQTFGRDLMAACAGLKSRVGSGNLRFYEGIGLKETGHGA